MKKESNGKLSFILLLVVVRVMVHYIAYSDNRHTLTFIFTRTPITTQHKKREEFGKLYIPRHTYFRGRTPTKGTQTLGRHFLIQQVFW